MLGGLCGALLAAVPRLIDMLSLHTGSTKKIALVHMANNRFGVALYFMNVYLRYKTVDSKISMLMSELGIVHLGISGW